MTIEECVTYTVVGSFVWVIFAIIVYTLVCFPNFRRACVVFADFVILTISILLIFMGTGALLVNFVGNQ